jgi:DNA invertase Pin-like site-specific DNA recombinase
MHVHHIVPLASGGTNRITNLASLCDACHGKIHDIDFTNFRELTRRGIEQARRNGTKLGRPRLDPDDSFPVIYALWKTKEISAIEARRRSGMTRNTFYRRVKEYEEEISC